MFHNTMKNLVTHKNSTSSILPGVFDLPKGLEEGGRTESGEKEGVSFGILEYWMERTFI